MKISPDFPHQRAAEMIKIRQSNVHKNVQATLRLKKISTAKVTSFKAAKELSYYPHLFLVWLRFGTRDLEIFLFGICDFCENRRREEFAFQIL
jgi:hypothetical protein